MSNEAIILTLLTIIGCLLGTCVGLFMNNIKMTLDAIKKDMSELTDMFTRHVRNDKIHVARS